MLDTLRSFQNGTEYHFEPDLQKVTVSVQLRDVQTKVGDL